ncbi:MAG: tetratricopeptide repeat protein, partial [SAR324 cluster bacterium]|nr:tetratricopeptide repeat protein [SAR324 cluster bacterium]
MKKKRHSKSKPGRKRQHIEKRSDSSPLQEKELHSRKAVARHVFYSFAIFVLFFVGIELLLALLGIKPILLTDDPLVGFAGNVPLFVEQQRNDGKTILKTAKNKLTYFNDQEFPKIKDKNSYRIFIVGGSTAYGRPYDHKASFGGWLHAFLKAAEPEKNWEVINAGGISYASFRVAQLMKELVRYQPDLFIIYSGHNEFLEERSYGQLADFPPWLIELNSWLNGTRLYSSMKRLYDSWRPDSMKQARKRYQVSGEVDTILSQSHGPTSYHRDDALQRQILTHYRLNLERMVFLARDAGAESIFITPVNNLKDMSPFKSEHKKGLTEESLRKFDNLVDQGKELHAAGNFSAALALFREALQIDERYADLHFQSGRALFELKLFEDAERSFWQAVDEDVAPLRILSSMQTILAEVAAKHGVALLDFQMLLQQTYQQKYPHTVFGREFFLDHVHPSIDGYRILGLGLLDLLIEQEIVSGEDPLDEVQIDKVVHQISSSLNKQDHSQALIQLAKVLDWAGKFDEAHHILMRNLELNGPQGAVFAQLGRTLSKKGNDQKAFRFFEKAIDAGYERPWIYLWMADTHRIRGNYSLALEAYQDKLRLDGNKLEAHTHFGMLSFAQGDHDSARTHFKQALRLKPDFLPARINLVSTLFIS